MLQSIDPERLSNKENSRRMQRNRINFAGGLRAGGHGDRIKEKGTKGQSSGSADWNWGSLSRSLLQQKFPGT